MFAAALVALDALGSTTLVLGLFAAVLTLAGLAYQVGLLNRLVRLLSAALQNCLETGFDLWRRLFSWAPWPVLLALLLALHYLALYDGDLAPARELLGGLALLFLG